MKVEDFKITGRLGIFNKAYTDLNDKLFNNSLQLPCLQIYGNTFKYAMNYEDEKGVYGLFIRPGDYYKQPRIQITQRLIEDIKDASETYQANIITRVMLHEMIHYFCFTEGIDDSKHNKNFMKAAEEHGLISIYENDIQQHEHMLSEALQVAFNLAEFMKNLTKNSLFIGLRFDNQQNEYYTIEEALKAVNGKEEHIDSIQGTKEACDKFKQLVGVKLEAVNCG